MNANIFAAVVLFGAFALALWVDGRWPQFAPRNFGHALLHVFASALLSSLLVSRALDAGGGRPAVLLTTLVAVVLPLVVYCLIAGIWLIKVAQAAISDVGQFRQ
jgi:hypothetical protein